jgi:hypothetical protein
VKKQHEYTINSTEDISRALADAESNGYELTRYNSAFYLRGTAGEPISVDDSLANLYVTAYGPAPVWVSGKGNTAVIAEESAVVYATERGVVDAYDSATVYAYGSAMVSVNMEAAAYISSDDVDVDAFDSSKVYLPASGVDGSLAWVRTEDDAQVIRGGAVPEDPTN